MDDQAFSDFIDELVPECEGFWEVVPGIDMEERERELTMTIESLPPENMSAGFSN